MNTVKISDHIDVDHREYSVYDNLRNIAHIADGLKPSQRKVIYTMMETVKGSTEIKVANLGSRASDLTHYQHGEDSINETVVGLAQDFAGANNMPLLLKEGQFGNQHDNGNSEVRYIYVKRHANLDKIFSQDDKPVLVNQFYDGEKIEPEFFLPKLPLLLINGSRGTGNGYASRILPRSVKDVKKATLAVLRGAKIPDLLPFFNGFAGTVTKNGSQYVIKGTFERVNQTTLRITSLPPDSTFQYENYKKRVLLKLFDNKEINSFKDDSTEDKWDITIKAPKAFVSMTDEQLEKKLGLIWNITETLNCWDWNGKIGMYSTIEDILRDWVAGRLVYMEQRRLSLIERHKKENEWLTYKILFIRFWNSNSQSLIKMKKQDLFAAVKTALIASDEIVSRLLALRISSLTLDEVDALEEEITQVIETVKQLESETASTLLEKDIASL